MNLEEELKKIDDFIKTPVSERPRYKEFHEKVKRIAEEEQATKYEPKWMREAYVWMANRLILQRIQQEESEEYLRIANYKTKLLFQLLEDDTRRTSNQIQMGKGNSCPTNGASC